MFVEKYVPMWDSVRAHFYQTSDFHFIACVYTMILCFAMNLNWFYQSVPFACSQYIKKISEANEQNWNRWKWKLHCSVVWREWRTSDSRHKHFAIAMYQLFAFRMSALCAFECIAFCLPPLSLTVHLLKIFAVFFFPIRFFVRRNGCCCCCGGRPVHSLCLLWTIYCIKHNDIPSDHSM